LVDCWVGWLLKQWLQQQIYFYPSSAVACVLPLSPFSVAAGPCLEVLVGQSVGWTVSWLVDWRVVAGDAAALLLPLALLAIPISTF
jgi:hypothetical protein